MMWSSSISLQTTLAFAAILTLLPPVLAIKFIETKSLNPCQANSLFTATLFDVIFTPNNGSLAYNINGVTSISGNVIAEFVVIFYGFNVLKKVVDPCQNKDFKQLCPMSPGQIVIDSNFIFDQDIVKQIPGLVYGVPDLDGVIRIYINSTATNTSVACVEADLSNGKTVYQKAVAWTTAVIAGLALLASAVTSGLGHSNTAAHVAANALSLFGFFQAQAIIGMTSVQLPPVVQSWTQNFQWSMGIIRIGFVENIATWYQRSTGGTPSTIVSSLATTSVEVQKRSLRAAGKLMMRSLDVLNKRTNTASTSTQVAQVTIVRGIQRVGFRAGIEPTNIFLTGLAFFVAFVFIVALSVALFKGFCELAAKAGWMKGDKFQEFRNGWRIVLKGILFRIVSPNTLII